MPASEVGEHEGRFLLVSTSTVIALMIVESALGLSVRGLYHEETWAVAALRGNDLVTLVVVVPLLTIALWRRRYSRRWLLVLLGGLLYGVYNFAYYAFGTTFNSVFLPHIATLALSIAGLVALCMTTDVEGIGQPTVPHPADRLIAAYMTLIGAGLIVAWGGSSLRFAITGRLPRDVMPPSAVHLVYALDMSLLAPAFITGGLLLWRRRPWGYALGVAVNLFGAAYLLVLEFVGGFEANAGIEGKTWNSPPAIIGAVLCAAAGATLMGRLSAHAPVVAVDAGRQPTSRVLSRSA